jgi:biopolymer transport protein TolR
MNNQTKRRPMADINVVPYIDVMLVLLVIFMITAPMLTQGVKVDLPRTQSDPVANQDPNAQLIITIDQGGAYFIERGAKEPEAADEASVSDYVSKVLNQVPSTQVLVRGDAMVPYGAVVELMTILQAAGAPSVGLVTEAP